MFITPQNNNTFLAYYDRKIQITDEYACLIKCKTIITKNEDNTYNVYIHAYYKSYFIVIWFMSINGRFKWEKV